MLHRKSLKLHEIEDELEQWDDVQDIYIESPEVAEHTDEDSADEDTGGVIDNLTGRQLLATAEIVTRTKSLEENDDAAAEDLPGPSSKKRKVSYNWKKADLPHLPSTEFVSSLSHNYEGKSCTDMFELFFDDDLCQFLIHETTKYALF